MFNYQSFLVIFVAFMLSFFSFSIYVKINHFYKISSYQGFKLFKDAFLLTGFAIVMKAIYDIFFLSVEHLLISKIILVLFVGLFLSGSSFLTLSLFWKKLDQMKIKQSYIVGLVYLLIIIDVFLGFRGHSAYYLVIPILMVGIINIFLKSRISKEKRVTHLFAMVTFLSSWIVNYIITVFTSYILMLNLLSVTFSMIAVASFWFKVNQLSSKKG